MCHAHLSDLPHRCCSCFFSCVAPPCLQNLREVKVLRRYHIQVREDYLKYNRLVGGVHRAVHLLKKLPEDDALRIQQTEALMNKLSVVCDAGRLGARAQHVA